MPGYFKSVVRQTYAGQELINVLYHGDAGGAPFASYSTAHAVEVGAEVLDAFAVNLAPEQPDIWTLADATVSFVDARGVTDPATPDVVVAGGTPGLVPGPTDGQFITSIIAFRGVVASGADRLVKRSYIAVGPLRSASVDNDGTIIGAWLAAGINLANALAAPLTTGSFGAAYPVRIGRTVAPEPIAVTAVTFGTVRPVASIRSSRKRRPTG